MSRTPTPPTTPPPLPSHHLLPSIVVSLFSSQPTTTTAPTTTTKNHHLQGYGIRSDIAPRSTLSISFPLLRDEPPSFLWDCCTKSLVVMIDEARWGSEN
ncbi:hypothetical protein L1987_23686 [Smallanthus sonchifolius]|uniref:Uncharacterized protein n=1 Tax=Smallanthus sonchifolius TaxID=185202 RepID=A0ACB9IIY1_9ASTR|nr:hypothetical protein L1987_23686 [Smallanthus sonchifolius]